ncbi:type VII toxin-antitoxin system HepT family RNase toxin [Halosimplex amylolyticum]|uniref:type VII toxin-antitoxin system HepT family RNase toxin n=1 Tax=Halosimplex amylolyticum TaxID=3396616 RepID=UPI003F546AB8
MVDEAIVADKLRHVNEYTRDQEEMRGMSKAEYVEDVVIQRAVERTLMNLIQTCIDLAQHVRAGEGLEPSGTAKQEIEAIGNADVISAETQERLEEAVGFRNVLAHRYGDVDHDVVYDVLHTDLHWFERFQREVAQWFQQHHQ